MKGQCHCGAVRWSLAVRPEKLTDCNCSICRSLGALWAHAPVEEVTVHPRAGATIRYIRKDLDGDLVFHSCKICGCTTHWSPAHADGTYMAVNAKLADPNELRGISVRRFDGADTWKFLD